MVHCQVQRAFFIFVLFAKDVVEDGIVLPKHVGAIVKSKQTYNLVHLLVYHYI
jgi:hypothetical protein